jgi:pre-mRNA-splicing factor ATP-dependent RNA helicase DHX38/PRP16
MQIKSFLFSPLKKMSDENFVHDIAVDISRALNLTNPNDLIAKKVIHFAETNKDFDKFSKGKI